MAYTASADYVAGTRGAREVTPARDAFAITASATDLARYPRAVWVGAAGTITGIPIDAAADTEVTFTMASAMVLPVGFRRITACPSGTLGLI